MSTSKKLAPGSTINVRVPAKLTLEQTNAITAEVLNYAGCPRCYSGFRIQFGEENEFVSAAINERNEAEVNAL